MRVEHELRERTVEAGDLTAHKDKARTRELRGRIKVHPEGTAHVDVVLDREVEFTGRAPAADFDVFRFVLADRHGFVREVRDAKEKVVQLRADFFEFLFENRELFRDGRGAGHDFGGVFTGALGLADLLREGVAFRLQFFGLRLNVLAARFQVVEFGFREVEAAALQTGRNFRELLTQHVEVEHGFPAL